MGKKQEAIQANIEALSQITFIIKAFERPEALERLLASIDKYYGYAGKALTVMIADDSKTPHPPTKSHRCNLVFFQLEFDSGLSHGRNYMLDRVKTKYFLLLDDDFIFTKHTDILEMYRMLESHPQIDILAGTVMNGRKKVRSNCTIKFTDGILYKIFCPYKREDGLNYYDFVVNFFLAKSEPIQKIRWNDEFKLVEHTAFFLDCYRHGIISAEIPKVKVLHKKMSSPHYNQFRKDRAQVFVDKLMEQYKINKIIETRVDK